MDVEEENKNNEDENNTIDFDSLSKHDLERLLVASAKDGVLERAKLLLEKGASPDAKEYNRSLFYASENYTTPLQNAASGGFHELTRYLIEHEGILFCIYIFFFSSDIIVDFWHLISIYYTKLYCSV